MTNWTPKSSSKWWRAAVLIVLLCGFVRHLRLSGTASANTSRDSLTPISLQFSRTAPAISGWVPQNGLYRYDGSQFQRYGAAEGIPDRIIDTVFIGLDGTVWVGTTAGVYFEGKDGKFSAVHLPYALNEFAHPTGTTFTSIKPDEVVTASSSRGVVLKRRGSDDWVAEPLNLKGGFVWSAMYGPDGALWYGCDKDLCRLKDGRKLQLRNSLKLPEDKWVRMMVARNGHLWLRSDMHVVEMMPDGSRADVRNLPGDTTSEAYQTLAEDNQGRILTSQGSSLALWEKDHWRLVTEQNGLSPYEIQELFVDREGSIWMGVVGHGLLRWVGEDRWEAYTQNDGLSDNLVWAVQRDHQGRLWIGTDSGLDWIPAKSKPSDLACAGNSSRTCRIAGDQRGWRNLDGQSGWQPHQD